MSDPTTPAHAAPVPLTSGRRPTRSRARRTLSVLSIGAALLLPGTALLGCSSDSEDEPTTVNSLPDSESDSVPDSSDSGSSGSAGSEGNEPTPSEDPELNGAEPGQDANQQDSTDGTMPSGDPGGDSGGVNGNAGGVDGNDDNG